MDKFNNNTQVKKHKFNIVDVMAIVFFLILAVMLFLFADPLNWLNVNINTEHEETIVYILQFDSFEKRTNDKIEAGEYVTAQINGGEQISKVLDVTKRTMYEWKPNYVTNTMDPAQKPLYDSVFVTIQVNCTYKEGEGYFVNNKQFLIGDMVSVKFPNCENVITGKCISIKRLAEGASLNEEG